MITLEARDLKKSFGSTVALNGVTLSFSHSTMHGVIGPEGAGKTTLMRILLGLLKPQQGSVIYRWEGRETAFESLRERIAYMPQSQSLYPDLSVGEHLDFFRALYGIREEEYRRKRKELLHITRLADFVKLPAGKLSGGMYKKLGLMCALLRAPQAILLDEPTNGVDPISRREFWELLYRLSDQKILIVLSTAYMDEAERCGHVHLLDQGKVVAQGEPRALLEHEGVRTFDELFLRRASDKLAPREGTRPRGAPQGGEDERVEPSPPQPETARAQSVEPRRPTPLAVEVRGLLVKFGTLKAVNEVSFSVHAGEIFGFLGANGAGKTTTIRVLCGLLRPTHGSVRVAGVGFEQGERQIKTKVGYMSQRFTLYNDLSVEENLRFTADLRKMETGLYQKRRDELFQLISFDRALSSKVADLPGGVKQQVSLAAALLHDPDIVFLDEPTAGVTPAARARFWSLIQEIAHRGKTVFVTTHYMDEAEQCGRIALMRTGRLIALDSPAMLKKAIFPNALLEFEPRRPMAFEALARMKSQTVFSYFEPYGPRFHAAIGDPAQWERSRPDFERDFHIRPIAPTLEDVFIQAVEGTPQVVEGKSE